MILFDLPRHCLRRSDKVMASAMAVDAIGFPNIDACTFITKLNYRVNFPAIKLTFSDNTFDI